MNPLNEAMINVQVNGEALEVPLDTTVGGLLQHLRLADRRVAVEVNEEIVPAGRHHEHRLAEDDKIEVVHAIGGG